MHAYLQDLRSQTRYSAGQELRGHHGFYLSASARLALTDDVLGRVGAKGSPWCLFHTTAGRLKLKFFFLRVVMLFFHDASVPMLCTLNALDLLGIIRHKASH